MESLIYNQFYIDYTYIQKYLYLDIYQYHILSYILILYIYILYFLILNYKYLFVNIV